MLRSRRLYRREHGRESPLEREFRGPTPEPAPSLEDAARQLAEDPELLAWRDEIRHAIPRGRP